MAISSADCFLSFGLSFKFGSVWPHVVKHKEDGKIGGRGRVNNAVNLDALVPKLMRPVSSPLPVKAS